jgi:enterochelin esterase-like enzyme
MTAGTLLALVAGPALWPPTAVAASDAGALPRVPAGRIERLAALPSRWVPARTVDVWLPPGYRPQQPRPVLYMHDGQMLFDAATTWNRQAWNVAATAARLAADGRLVAPIVVGVWNRPDARYAEYFPQKALSLAGEDGRAYVQREQGGRSLADAYLRFLVEELKPEIDRRYATVRGPEGTCVAGSSMGGLISLYALCEHPQVFGAAAGLSTHWVGRGAADGIERVRNGSLPLALLNYLAAALPPPGRHRLWLDRGDDALDSLYAPGLALAGELLRDRGWGPAQAQLRVFPGTGHNEADWAARFGEVLQFLLGPAPAPGAAPR